MSPLSVLSLKDSVVTVEPFTYILKVADTVVVTDTLVAPLDGFVELTVSYSFTGSPPPAPLPPDGAVVRFVAYMRLVFDSSR